MDTPYIIDPRRTWAMPEKFLAEESDPRRRQILETLISHAKAESRADFESLMGTVSPRAHYRSYATDDPAMNEAQSPQGKDGIAAYYRAIVESGCHFLEHATERMAVGSDTITTEGELKMAYPGKVLDAMGIAVSDPDSLYLYQQRLMIVWDFDEDGLVLCEDSYSGGGVKFDGIADRPVSREQIYTVSPDD